MSGRSGGSSGSENTLRASGIERPLNTVEMLAMRLMDDLASKIANRIKARALEEIYRAGKAARSAKGSFIPQNSDYDNCLLIPYTDQEAIFMGDSLVVYRIWRRVFLSQLPGSTELGVDPATVKKVGLCEAIHARLKDRTADEYERARNAYEQVQAPQRPGGVLARPQPVSWGVPSHNHPLSGRCDPDCLEYVNDDDIPF